MRVRITQRRPGEVDGVDLSTFEVGLTYDVSPSLATYLIMTGTADPIVDERPALVVPVDEMPIDETPVDEMPRNTSRTKSGRRLHAVAADKPRS
jgi:hypothetical protein